MVLAAADNVQRVSRNAAAAAVVVTVADSKKKKEQQQKPTAIDGRHGQDFHSPWLRFRSVDCIHDLIPKVCDPFRILIV